MHPFYSKSPVKSIPQVKPSLGKYIITPSVMVGWYLFENEVLNLSVYIKYGFLATTKLTKNLIRHVL